MSDWSLLKMVKMRSKNSFHRQIRGEYFQHCGTPLYSYRTDLPDVIRLRLGIVTEGHIPAPAKETHLESKLPFVEITTVFSE